MKKYTEREIKKAVQLIRSIGASETEVSEIDRRDVVEHYSGIYVWVGFGDDKRLIKALDDTPLRLANASECKRRKRLVTQVPALDDVQRAQGHFTRVMYEKYAAKDISRLPERQVFVDWDD